MSSPGLLVLRSSRLCLGLRVRQGLGAAKGRLNVSSTLYVLFARGEEDLWKFRGVTPLIYSAAASICPTLDVRLLLPQAAIPKKPFKYLIVEDGKENSEETITKLNLAPPLPPIERIPTLNERPNEDSSLGESFDPESEMSGVVAVGGTFDRLHNGHKILLSEALSRTKNELIVGVTNEEMIKKKTLHDLIEPLESRMNNVREFLASISPPNVSLRIVVLSDVFGPTVSEEEVEAIVVSRETQGGATKINSLRQERGYPPLRVHTIELSSEPEKKSHLEEEKISSSSARIRLLGTRFKSSLKPPTVPIIIGLTGGIGSGKSSACAHMAARGVKSINCDELGHEAYKKGSQCLDKIVEAFGPGVINSSGDIDRKTLGSRVFGDEDELKKLTNIVWPEIKRLVEQRIQDLVKQGNKVIVLDAAVLIEAGWDSLCNEIFVFFIEREEAIRRLRARDGLEREEAERRIDSQLSNEKRIQKATFVFCSFWEPEFTKRQVNEALDDLYASLPQENTNTNSKI